MYLPEEFQAFDKLMCNVSQYVFGCLFLFGYKILHACNSWLSMTLHLWGGWGGPSPAVFLRISEPLGSKLTPKKFGKKTWLMKVSDDG